jgi:HK97 gp10 family phage protein
MPDNTFNHFGDIANAIPDIISKVVRKVAFDVQSDAQSLAPRDTGFLANSIYVKTSKDSSYSQVGQPTSKDASLLPEMETPPDDQTAYVAVGANYGIYLEYGTRFQPPQPYLTPAVEAGQTSLENAASEIESMIEDAIG